MLNLERLDLTAYIGLRQYLDAERFGAVLSKGCNFCISTNELNTLTVFDALNLLECSWGSKRKSDLKTAMFLLCSQSTGAGVCAVARQDISRDAVRAFAAPQDGVLLKFCAK